MDWIYGITKSQKFKVRDISTKFQLSPIMPLQLIRILNLKSRVQNKLAYQVLTGLNLCGDWAIGYFGIDV